MTISEKDLRSSADSEYIVRLQQKEESALEELIRRYGRFVSAVVLSVSGGALGAGDVEEIASDVFLVLWETADRVDISRPFKPYLAKIARNRTINRLRARRLLAEELDEALFVVRQEGPEEWMAVREQSEIINSCVAQMAREEREIFVRHYFWNEKLARIAERMGMGLSTVKSKLHRSRGKLRKALEERGYRCYETR